MHLRLIVLCAAALHFGWAILLIFDMSAWGATPLSALQMFGRIGGIVTLLVIGTLAVLAGWFSTHEIKLVLLLPQQGLLFMSSGTALEAMWAGHYADGVIRAHAFIIADQLPTCVIAILHLGAVFREL